MTFDELNIALSRELQDPVAAASTNGKRYSSARRVDILNQAIRRWADLQVRAGNYQALSGYIQQKSKALSSNLVSLTAFDTGSNIGWILSIYDTTLDLPVYQLPQELYAEAVTGDNQYLAADSSNLYWLVENGNLRVSGAGASDTVAVRYIESHTDLAVGGTIKVPSEYHHQVLDLSTALGLRDAPTAFSVSRAAVLENSVMKEILGNGDSGSGESG